MADYNLRYIWRCARCANHFSNITYMDGTIRQEKKCPKCKAHNILEINGREVTVRFRLIGEDDMNGYGRADNGRFPPPY